MHHRHNLQDRYFKLMASGHKRVEARRSDASAASPGDTITFMNTTTGDKLDVVVTDVRMYTNQPTLAENIREYLVTEAAKMPLGDHDDIEAGIDLMVGMWSSSGLHRDSTSGVRAYTVGKRVIWKIL